MAAICLSAAVGQTSAQVLYRSFGFQSIGVERKALMVGDRFYDEEHMQLEL